MWIRTDYGPGTDGSFKEVLQGFSDNSSRREIVQDAKCYKLPDGDLKPVLAFFPILVGAEISTTQKTPRIGFSQPT